MKRIKRIVSIIMSMMMLLGTLAGCGKKDTASDNSTDKYITRGAWVEAIGTMWGMDEYSEEVPYFTDVPSDSDIFPYVQSCYEWKVISTDATEFKKDDVATLGFAVSSATMILLGDVENITNEELLQEAVKYGLLNEKDNNKSSLSSGITAEQADEIITIAQKAYLCDVEERICDIQLADGVKDYSEDKDAIDKKDENTYTVKENIAGELSDGDVFIAYDSEEISGQKALKVADKKDNGDGTYTITTEDPELEEIFESVDIEGTYYADYNSVEAVDGLEVVPLDGNSQTSYSAGTGSAEYADCIVMRDVNGNIIQTKDYEVNKNTNWSFKGKLGDGGIEASVTKPGQNADATLGIGVGKDGKISVKPEIKFDDASSIKVEVTPHDTSQELADALKDNNVTGKDLTDGMSLDAIKDYASGLITEDSLKEKLGKNAKESVLSPAGSVKSGYSIEGGVAFKNLALTADIKTSGFSIKKASVRLSGQIENSLTLKGKLNTELALGKITFPIGPVTIVVTPYLYADFNGSLSIKTTITLDNKIDMQGKTARKCINNNVESDVEANLTVEAGPALAVSVGIVGVDLISLRLKVGVMLEAKLTEKAACSVADEGDNLVYTNKSSLAFTLTLYAPMVTVELNKTKGCLGGKLFSASWNIIDKSVIDKGKKTESGIGSLCIKQQIVNVDNDIYTCVIKIPKTSAKEEETGLGDYLSLEHLSINVFIGENAELKIENIPEGYEKSDIVWSSDDKNIAEFSNGHVKGISEGTTTVRAKTSDGKYETSCLVTVSK